MCAYLGTAMKAAVYLVPMLVDVAAGSVVVTAAVEVVDSPMAGVVIVGEVAPAGVFTAGAMPTPRRVPSSNAMRLHAATTTATRPSLIPRLGGGTGSHS